MNRPKFKLFVTIDSALTDVQDYLQQHKGYPIDNVIQIKLDTDAFKALFQDTSMSTSGELSAERYDATTLLTRFEDFFDRSNNNNHNKYNNINTTQNTTTNNTHNNNNNNHKQY